MIVNKLIEINESWEFVHNSFVIFFVYPSWFYFENNTISKASEKEKDITTSFFLLVKKSENKYVLSRGR